VFSTILTEVTGYFDRKVLISTFFPTLVFLGGTTLLLLVCEVGGQQTVATWNRQTGTVQAIILTGFLAVVAFWTIMMVNLRDAIDRAYQGYWPDVRLLNRLAFHQEARFGQRRDDLVRTDRELEDSAAAVEEERREFPTQGEFTGAPGQALAAPNDGTRLDQGLEALKKRLEAIEAATPAKATGVAGISSQLRELWKMAQPDAAPDQAGNAGWDARLKRLSRATERTSQVLDRLELRLQDKRADLQRDLFLYLPLAPAGLMPTALGNVMRAAELYPQQRYRLDGVVIWSRLQPLLPAEYTELLLQAKTSVDVLLTLSTYAWLFGVPLAVWSALRTSWPLSAAAPAVVLVIALAGALPALAGHGRHWTTRAAAVVILAAAVVSVACTALSSSRTSIGIVRATDALLLAVGVLLLSWAFYRNAVQATLSYAEKLKSAFDLYRWSVLEQLHISFPKDLREERVLWEQLTALLYRGTLPADSHMPYVLDSSQLKP
jgi:hypothetical protein